MNRIVLFIVISVSQIFADPYVEYRVVTVEKTSDINRDLLEFIKLFPTEKISSIVQDYIQNDVEVQNNWKFIQSQLVRDQIERIKETVEFDKVKCHLNETGINFGMLLLHLHHLVGHVSHQDPVPRAGQGLRGLLIGSIKPLIPVSQMKLLATQKFIFSSDFRRVTRILTSTDFKTAIMKLVSSHEVQMLESDAKANNVDLKAVYEFVGSFYFLYEYLIDM